MLHLDKNNNPLKIYDNVLVPEPNGSDIHSHEFVGTIKGFRGENSVVEDGDDNIFEIESKRLEINTDEQLPFFIVNNEYPYSKIEEFKNENPEYDEDDNGSFLVGANFISLIDDNETVISFVLISHNNNGGIYKCIYSDLK